MSNNYTPNQSVTVIDAKDVRGPGIMHHEVGDVFACEVGFRHHTGAEVVWPAGQRWNFYQGETDDYGLTILPEPFTEPKGEEDECEECGGEVAHYPGCPNGQSSKGDTDKPLTAESRALERLTNVATQWRADHKSAVNAIPSDDGPAWAAFAAANPVSVNIDDLWTAIGALKAVDWQQRFVRSSLAGEVPSGMKALGYNVALPQGYQYGPDAIEQVRLGARLATDAILAGLSSAPDALSEGREVAPRLALVRLDRTYPAKMLSALNGYVTGGSTRCLDELERFGVMVMQKASDATTPPTGPGQELVEAAKEVSRLAGCVGQFPRFEMLHAANARLSTAIANMEGAGK